MQVSTKSGTFGANSVTPRLIAINLHISYSVLDLVQAFEQARGKQVPRQVGPSHAVDIVTCYADSCLAMLGWSADRILNAWSWQSQNPQGYSGA